MIKGGSNSPVGGKGQSQKARIVEWPEGIRFLVAHENAPVRKFIKGCLKGLGCPTILELIPTGNILSTMVSERPHVLICAGETPEMEDWLLMKSIRRHPDLRRIKVVIVSGDSSKDSILGAVRNGVDDYIILPFSASTLEERICTLFSRGLE